MSGGRRPITYKKKKNGRVNFCQKNWENVRFVSESFWKRLGNFWFKQSKICQKENLKFSKKNKENSEFKKFKMFYRIKSDILRLISDIFYKKTPKFLIWKVKELWNKIGNLPDKNKKIYEF